MTKRRILAASCSIIIAIFTITLIFITLTTHSKYPMQYLKEGWHVTINDQEFDNVDISQLYNVYDQKFVRGDRIILSTKLPDNGYIPSAVLLFRSRYTAFYCYVNDKAIFHFGQEQYNQNKFSTKMYHIISLPSDYSGQTLTIDMTVAEKRPFNYIEPILFGNHSDVAGRFIHSNLFVIATAFTTFIFGAVFLGIALLFVYRVPDVASLLLGALFSLNIGAWLLCYYNLLSMFVYTTYESTIEYFTLYLVIPYCYLILYFIQDLKGNRLYTALMIAGCSLPIIQYILHYVFNIHLRETLFLFHVDGILGLSVIAYFSIKNLTNKNRSSSSMTQLTGLFVFTICEVMHLVIYIFQQLHIETIDALNKLIICGGSLFYVACQLSTYLIYITDSYAKKQENVSLSHLAYADSLTNLANRAKADKLMEELNSSNDDYCIISIDLNGLKIVNDKFGHPTGDRYIKDFAKVLLNTFGEDSFCARIGGDEFLVILKDTTSKDVDSLIERLNSALNVMNALYTEYRRSVATGYAFKHECDGRSSHEVYLLADQRMYNLKRKMHEELGIHVRL